MQPDAVLRAFLEQVWNQRHMDRFGEFVAKDVVFHPPRGATHDHTQYEKMAQAFMAAFPDLHFDIKRTTMERDLVAAQIVITGTNDGPFRGKPATGRKVRVEGRPWARVQDGRIFEFWQSFDELGLLAQLGHFDDAALLGAPFSRS